MELPPSTVRLSALAQRAVDMAGANARRLALLEGQVETLAKALCCMSAAAGLAQNVMLDVTSEAVERLGSEAEAGAGSQP